ncbi:hypothetical protein BDV96DRAFT_647190 [Lophiotrema nucula]|uniref:Uncharacterized protein n=1 Tax=Lophiotrema nucula TaxID=690887 RepID=A0A6A5Z6R4_9PLEO|nr:hypothetical protein BDV96DRAFT_647190 [Lophiotrema nucula]
MFISPPMIQVKREDLSYPRNLVCIDLDSRVPLLMRRISTSSDGERRSRRESAQQANAIGGACKDHNELRRLKKRELGKRNDWSWDFGDYKSLLSWSFTWEDQGDQCPLSCLDAFNEFIDNERCIWDGAMSKKGSITTECGIASYSVERQEPKLPDKWRLYVLYMTQEVRPGASKIEWQLTAAGENGESVNIEGPSTWYDVQYAKFNI